MLKEEILINDKYSPVPAAYWRTDTRIKLRKGKQMRPNRQTAREALRNTDEYRTERERRGKAVMKAAVPVLSFITAVLLGLGLWKSGISEERHVPVSGPGDTLPQTENGGDELPVGSASVIIDDCPNAPAACYSVPKAGEFGISMPLRAAMEEYGGEDVQFRLVMDIFDGTGRISDRELLLEEAERLNQLGYDAEVEAVTFGYMPFETGCFFLTASREQIENFDPRPNRGYFMFLYKEYMRAAELIDY